MNYEELLENAPDHLSNDFILYLVNNNKLVKVLNSWLVIENCKYHNENRTWWTAFYIGKGALPTYRDIGILFTAFPEGMAIFQNPENERTIKRTHYHVTPMRTPRL